MSEEQYIELERKLISKKQGKYAWYAVSIPAKIVNSTVLKDKVGKKIKIRIYLD